MTCFFSYGSLILRRGTAPRAPSIAGLVLQGRIYAARVKGHQFNLLFLCSSLPTCRLDLWHERVSVQKLILSDPSQNQIFQVWKWILFRSWRWTKVPVKVSRDARRFSCFFLLVENENFYSCQALQEAPFSSLQLDFLPFCSTLTSGSTARVNLPEKDKDWSKAWA